GPHEERRPVLALRDRHGRADVRQGRESKDAPCDDVASAPTEPGRQAPFAQHVARDLAVVERDEQLGGVRVGQRQESAGGGVAAARAPGAVSSGEDRGGGPGRKGLLGERDRRDDQIGAGGSSRRQELDAGFAQALGPACDSVEDDRRRGWMCERKPRVDGSKAQRRISWYSASKACAVAAGGKIAEPGLPRV